MSRPIIVSAQIVVTDDAETYHISPTEQQLIIRRQLAERLSQLIANDRAFYHPAVKDEERRLTTYRAECYVLTPDEYQNLVDAIYQSIQSGFPYMLGGAARQQFP